ncbi:hypothetical protein [Marinicella sp. W31]|uniref:hypothetical protein n=1 Tax=Marinicella sp. W31 TaxID=3023713 RepID=UPI0037572950
MKKNTTCLYSVTILSLLLSISSHAADIICDGTWEVFQCADGTTMGCSSEGVQMDCTQNGWGDMADDFCSSHGGVVGIVTDLPTCQAMNDEVRINPNFAVNGTVLNACSVRYASPEGRN